MSANQKPRPADLQFADTAQADDSSSEVNPTVKPLGLLLGDRLTIRLDSGLRPGVSRRVIERERFAGRFPKPDLTIGRMPLASRDDPRRGSKAVDDEPERPRHPAPCPLWVALDLSGHRRRRT